MWQLLKRVTDFESLGNQKSDLEDPMQMKGKDWDHRISSPLRSRENYSPHDVGQEPGWLALKLIPLTSGLVSDLKSVDQNSGELRDANSGAVLISVSGNSAPRCLAQVLTLVGVVYRRMSGFSLTLPN